MELKKCARCGKFFVSDVDVCNECEKKDLLDIRKLKGYFADEYVNGVSKLEISASTGISNRNLTRYLGFEEFNDIYVANNENGNFPETNIYNDATFIL